MPYSTTHTYLILFEPTSFSEFAQGYASYLLTKDKEYTLHGDIAHGTSNISSQARKFPSCKMCYNIQIYLQFPFFINTSTMTNAAEEEHVHSIIVKRLCQCVYRVLD